MTTKQLSLPIDGLRAGLLGGTPMDAAYMAGIESRARMLAKACSLPKAEPEKPQDKYIKAIIDP